jgi:hypothetical protein
VGVVRTYHATDEASVFFTRDVGNLTGPHLVSEELVDSDREKIVPDGFIGEGSQLIVLSGRDSQLT